MKNLTFIAIFLFSSVLFSQTVNKAYQTSTRSSTNCNVDAFISDTIIVEGDGVTLSASGLMNSGYFTNDFDNHSVGNGWEATSNAMFTNPCGGGPDNSSCLWQGTSISPPRYLKTESFDLRSSDSLFFWMKFATEDGGGTTGNCEGPDHNDEGVSLQYSINGGSNWTDIIYYNPGGFTESHNPHNSSSSSNGYTYWFLSSLEIPDAAKTTNTIFQWLQESASGVGNDAWGLDNIKISAPSFPYYEWTSNPVGFTSTEQNPEIVYPPESTWYYVKIYNDEGDFCLDSVYVEVHNNYFFAETATICNNDTILWHNNYYTSAGEYFDNLTSVYGSDSIYRLTITTEEINILVTQENGSLVAEENDAEYQWYLCKNLLLIENATEQTFIPDYNDNYFVVITKGNCIDTSLCYNYTLTDISNYNNTEFDFYPNPVSVNQRLNINGNFTKGDIIQITSIKGKEIYKNIISTNKNTITINNNNLEISKGFYVIKYINKQYVKTAKIIFTD